MAQVKTRSATRRTTLEDRERAVHELEQKDKKESKALKKESPETPKKSNVKKAVISGRMSGVKRENTHLLLPKELSEVINNNISGSQIAVYTTLLALGYEVLDKKAKETGGLVHIDLEEVLETIANFEE